MLAGQRGLAAAGGAIEVFGAAEDVEQAAAIGADDGLGAAGLEAVDLVGDDGLGDGRMAQREGAAEAAAFLGPRLLRDRHLAKPGEQRRAGFMHAHVAARVAGGMQRDGAGRAAVRPREADDGARLVGIAAGIGRLAAAGLRGGKVDRDAFAFEQTHGVEAGFRRELVDQAGGEQIANR